MSGSSREFFDSVRRELATGEARRPTSGEFPQWMRRCFMTGKQCIFCPQETVFEDGSDGHSRDSVFVIMPFRPNLDTFYEWSLKPYLASFGISSHRILRADQFANTGYVMCEKICLRIQQAGLVVVDLSLINPNVYYELGLAVGLNKPLLAICDQDKWSSSSLSRKLCDAVGIDHDRVLRYPNVGHLDGKRFSPLRNITKVSLSPRIATAQIAAILVRDSADLSSDVGSKEGVDIPVSFQRALEAAVGVAVRALDLKRKDTATSSELAAAFESLGDDIGKLAQCKVEHLTTEAGDPQPFEKVARLADGSLISIIDLASENALAYFWLGYCHSRNINVIPIYRNQSSRREEAEQVSLPETSKMKKDHVLAFDIRALWYMNHTPKETKDLADKLAAVLEPILVRDVTTQQRRVFWERLTRSGRVHIYNGAVHHRELNREVVGDWDLRTASELISYLSSREESVVPVLQSPIYAPETIAEKLDVRDPDERFLSAYVELVHKELAGKNCLIVASADVNPITEVVLAYIYDDLVREGRRDCFCGPVRQGDDATVIAIKGEMPGREQHSGAAKLPRRFSRTTSDVLSLDINRRGFLIDGRPQVLAYYSQDQGESEFSILAHLIVARNPFTPENNVVVILNGVSGPATFGLAEVLTGGAGGTKSRQSEAILKTINRVWSDEVEGGALRRLNGVEAILEINVLPPERYNALPLQDEEVSRLSDLKNKFYDKRTVAGWDFFSPKELRIGNPRPVPN